MFDAACLFFKNRLLLLNFKTGITIYSCIVTFGESTHKKQVDELNDLVNAMGSIDLVSISRAPNKVQDDRSNGLRLIRQKEQLFIFCRTVV